MNGIALEAYDVRSTAMNEYEFITVDLILAELWELRDFPLTGLLSETVVFEECLDLISLTQIQKEIFGVAFTC